MFVKKAFYVAMSKLLLFKSYTQLDVLFYVWTTKDSLICDNKY